jgi:sporulation protein YlmC with PRC-barrel domain
MLARALVFILASAWGSSALAQASNASLTELMGARVQDLSGGPLGQVKEIIIDVRGAELVYLIVRDGEAARTFPFRAVAEQRPGALQLDTELASAMAMRDSPEDPRFRRASKLLGMDIVKPGGGPIGTIHDMQVDMASGEVKRVMAQTASGVFGFPPSVLAMGFFPPLTRQFGPDAYEASGNYGYVRKEASSERRSVQGDEAWDRN